jgi:hypothetical protein
VSVVYGREFGDQAAASEQGFMPRPLVQYPHPLADGQSDMPPMLGRSLEDAARLIEIATGVQHELDPQPVPAPLLNLVEVAAVGVVRVVGLLVGPVTHLSSFDAEGARPCKPCKKRNPKQSARLGFS